MQNVVRKLVQAPLVRTLATTAPKRDVPARELLLLTPLSPHLSIDITTFSLLFSFHCMISFSPEYLKIKEKQKWFNVDNGKRVHEVRGRLIQLTLYKLSRIVLMALSQRGSTDKALMLITQGIMVSKLFPQVSSPSSILNLHHLPQLFRLLVDCNY